MHITLHSSLSISDVALVVSINRSIYYIGNRYICIHTSKALRAAAYLGCFAWLAAHHHPANAPAVSYDVFNVPACLLCDCRHLHVPTRATRSLQQQRTTWPQQARCTCSHTAYRARTDVADDEQSAGIEHCHCIQRMDSSVSHILQARNNQFAYIRSIPETE